MSSSAFTPSTTTVTNNVPVNVPVVEAWQDYSLTIGATTTAPTKGTIVFDKASWRRVGDSIEIRYNYAQSTAGTAGSGTYLFPLPSGLTIDTSKVNLSTSASSSAKVGSGSSSLTNPANNNYELKVIPYNSSNLAVTVSTGTTTPAFIGSANLALSDIDRCYNFFATVPISQWAGSGTTTLATRAVEEYAWNSDTGVAANTTYSNSSFFGNGPNGTPLLAVASTTSGSSTRYVCQFQTSILPTDTIILEFSDDRTKWFPIGGGNNGSISSLMYQSGALYGASVRINTGNQVIVDFGNYGRVANGATYSAPGAVWSGLTGWFWRVRKVSSGAQVGYPVSARNIVGDTSGSVVPVGMLGEVLTFTARGGLVTTGGWRIPDTNPLVTLTAGNWIIYGRLLNTVGIAAGTTSMTGAISNSSVAGTGVGVPAVYGRLDNAFVAAGSGLEAPLSVNYVTVSQGSTLPLYAQFISSGANNTINISGYAIRIA